LIGQRDVRENIFQVLVVDGRVSDDQPVVIQHRYLAFRIDRHEPVGVLLELMQIDLNALKGQRLLDERNHGFQRVRHRFCVVILERHATLDTTGAVAGQHNLRRRNQ
jgi:hypothetical protein